MRCGDLASVFIAAIEALSAWQMGARSIFPAQMFCYDMRRANTPKSYLLFGTKHECVVKLGVHSLLCIQFTEKLIVVDIHCTLLIQQTSLRLQHLTQDTKELVYSESNASARLTKSV
jgi:hypothetical protein